MDKIKKWLYYEEISNAVSHGIGLGLSIAALSILLFLGINYGDVWYIVSFSIYGGSLIILYLASTLYHSVPKGKVKDALKIFDHSAIYVLIAGTYTPITLITLRGKLGYSIFAIIWITAIAGIIFKLFFSKRFKLLSTIMYLLMGWLAIFIIKPIMNNMNSLSLIFLILGGVVYSVGTIFYMWKKLKFSHVIWHLFVIGGSVFHFLTMYFMIPIA